MLHCMKENKKYFVPNDFVNIMSIINEIFNNTK